jgi:cold shock CspA family protein
MPTLFDDVEIDRHLRTQSKAPRKAKAKPQPKRETARVTAWNRNGYGFAVARDADDEIFLGTHSLAKSGITVPLRRGDQIEFTRIPSKKYPGKFDAVSIVKLAA